jgi:hypothetical protein
MPTTFKNNPALKRELVQRAEDHAAADRLVHGAGYFNGYNGHAKGCAIGCLATPVAQTKKPRWFKLKSREQGTARLKRDFGLPQALGDLAEAIFESYDIDDARERRVDLGRRGWVEVIPTTKSRGDKTWPARFAAAIPVGVKLTDADVEHFARGCEFIRTWGGVWRVGRVNVHIPQEDVPQAANATLRWLRSLS